MYCRKCGTTIPEDSVFCEKCGEKTTLGVAGDVITDGNIYDYEKAIRLAESSSQLPMNWYKFLTYVYLPITLIITIIRNYISLKNIINTIDMVLMQNIFYTVMSASFIVITNAFRVVAILKLHAFKLKGIKYYFIFIILNCLIPLVDFVVFIPSALYYDIWQTTYDTMLIGFVGGVAMSIFMYKANKTYFDKRKSMFS